MLKIGRSIRVTQNPCKLLPTQKLIQIQMEFQKSDVIFQRLRDTGY